MMQPIWGVKPVINIKKYKASKSDKKNMGRSVKNNIKFIFCDIAYGNGKYVVVGFQGYIAVLTDDIKVESSTWIKDTIDNC